MALSEPALYLRLLDIAANPHIVSLYNSLRNVLPEAVWWVSDETLGRIPFPAAPTTPFCSEALLNENLRNLQIEKAQELHRKPPLPGEVVPCCPGFCQGMAVFSYRSRSLGGIGLCHVPESQAHLLGGILTLLNGYLNLLSHTLEGNDDLEIVRSLWSETITVLDLNTLLRRVMDEIFRTISVDSGLIFLADEDGMFFVAHAEGVDPETFQCRPPAIGRISYAKQIARLFQKGTQCLDADDPLAVWIRANWPDWADKKILVVPFFRNEYFVGLFATGVAQPPAFSPSRYRLLDLLSTGGATALDNAMIFKRLNERRTALATIHTIHRLIGSTDTVQDLICRVSQQARQLLKAGKCALFLYDNRRENLIPRFTLGLDENEIGSRPVKPGEGLIGWVAESYQAIIYNPIPESCPPWRKDGSRYPERSYLAVPLVDEDLEGVLMLSGRKDLFTPGDRETLITIAEQIILAIHNAFVREGERHLAVHTLRGMANLLERGDPTTAGWTVEIADLSDRLARHLRLPERDRNDLLYASLLCRSSLLRSANMFHSDPASFPRVDLKISCDFIQSLGLSERVQRIVSAVGEHYDGSGEPEGLAANQIPIASRILAVATAYVAMTCAGMRGDRKVLTPQEAVEVLHRRVGTFYDPVVIKALEEILGASNPPIHTG
jgi:HD-GYP domain-containing protein (c-di-GMP phosphodiesterase class II)